MISENLKKITNSIAGYTCTLVAVSKTKPVSDILEAYQAGQRVFGENKVQELTEKEALLPKDIEWHLIGHLQTNKVKYIAPFVSLIHSVDSEKLLSEINKQAFQVKRIIPVLLQIYIAQEETKFGLDKTEALALLSEIKEKYQNVEVKGLMGMASNTENENQVKMEFRSLSEFYQQIKEKYNLTILSMGMSGDYKIALEEGSTMIRVGSSIFGGR